MQKTKQTVAIYVRKSREEEGGTEETLFTQRENLIRIAKNKGYSYDVYEEVESGYIIDRPQYLKMKEAILEDKYSRILVKHIDRLGRNKMELGELELLLTDCNVLIETPDNVIDLSNESHSMAFGINSIFAELEYKRIRHRLQSGKIDAVEIKNRWIGSIAPLGYKYDKNFKKLVIVPKEAEVIRKMVELALSGYSSRQIADKLKNLGYKSRGGYYMKCDRVLKILSNKVYLGQAKYNSTKLNKHAIAENCHEPIISETEYRQIESLFSSRRCRENLSSLGVKSPVNKLLVCGVCGKGLRIQKNNKITKVGKDASFYQIRPCRHEIDEHTKCYNRGAKVDYIENAVYEALLYYKKELGQALDKLLKEDTTEIDQKLQTTLQSLRANLKKKKLSAKKLLDLYLYEDNLLSKEDYNENKQEIEKSITALKYEIEVVKNRIENIDTTSQANRTEDVINMIDNFKRMELEEQNATLKLLISHIVFTRTPQTNDEPKIEIHWREL